LQFFIFSKRFKNVWRLLLERPSYILWMGTLSPERKAKSIQSNTEIPALHTSKFAPDYEQCIPKNVVMMSAAMLELFNNGGK
jgi:hippurate hydrolase